MSDENDLLEKCKLSLDEIKALERQSCNFVTYYPEKKEPTATVWYNLQTGEVYGVSSTNPRPFDPETGKGMIDTVDCVLVLFDLENNCAIGTLGENKEMNSVLEMVLNKIKEARRLRIVEKWDKVVAEKGALSVL